MSQCLSGTVYVKLNYPIVRTLYCDESPSQLGPGRQWSARHLDLGHHSTPGLAPSGHCTALVTNIKYASEGAGARARWSRERELCHVQGQVTCHGERSKTCCEDLCGQA